MLQTRRLSIKSRTLLNITVSTLLVSALIWQFLLSPSIYDLQFADEDGIHWTYNREMHCSKLPLGILVVATFPQCRKIATDELYELNQRCLSVHRKDYVPKSFNYFCLSQDKGKRSSIRLWIAKQYRSLLPDKTSMIMPVF